MKLGFEEAAAVFESPSQNARVWTESWVSHQLFCPNCGAADVSKYENNRPVADFVCRACNEDYELKSQKGRFGPRVVDGAFETMCRRLAANDNPNLLLMNYDLARLAVTDLMVVPKHFFTRDIIQQRKPLAPTARRAGWVGCNILLGQIPEAGRIFIVRGGAPVDKAAVRAQWDRTLFLRETGGEARGWLVEVMRCVERIGRPEFSLAEVYAFEPHLQRLFPGNNNVRPKIRQQLQVLRDGGYMEFVGRGAYRLYSRVDEAASLA